MKWLFLTSYTCMICCRSEILFLVLLQIRVFWMKLLPPEKQLAIDWPFSDERSSCESAPDLYLKHEAIWNRDSYCFLVVRCVSTIDDRPSCNVHDQAVLWFNHILCSNYFTLIYQCYYHNHYQHYPLVLDTCGKRNSHPMWYFSSHHSPDV